MNEPATKTATVLGATGLTGSELLRQLSEDPAYEHVVSLGRRELTKTYPKVTHRLLDFEDRGAYERVVEGDVLFSVLGTTLKTAGGKEAQWKVDYDYQLWAAQAAAARGISTYVLVSSVGADPEAAFFYSRMKGELEHAVEQLTFDRLRILRPSILDGERTENRRGERVALSLLRKIPSGWLPASARPVPVRVVAAACRKAALDPTAGRVVWEPDAIFQAGAG